MNQYYNAVTFNFKIHLFQGDLNLLLSAVALLRYFGAPGPAMCVLLHVVIETLV